jgi:uncharacterized membrane protein YgcG
MYRAAVDRAADEFRVLADGEPVDEQPGDVHDTLTRETTVDLGDVPVGKTVTVEWTAVDDAVEVGEHTVAPSAAFDVSYDATEDALTVEHAGGDTIDADDLSVVAPPSVERPTDWNGDGEVAEGDAATFEVTETPEVGYVVFDERELLDREQIGDESDDDGDGESDDDEGDSGSEAEGDGESESGGSSSSGGSGGSSSSGGSGSSTATAPGVDIA